MGGNNTGIYQKSAAQAGWATFGALVNYAAISEANAEQRHHELLRVADEQIRAMADGFDMVRESQGQLLEQAHVTNEQLGEISAGIDRLTQVQVAHNWAMWRTQPEGLVFRQWETAAKRLLEICRQRDAYARAVSQDLWREADEAAPEVPEWTEEQEKKLAEEKDGSSVGASIGSVVSVIILTVVVDLIAAFLLWVGVGHKDAQGFMGAVAALMVIPAWIVAILAAVWTLGAIFHIVVAPFSVRSSRRGAARLTAEKARHEQAVREREEWEAQQAGRIGVERGSWRDWAPADAGAYLEHVEYLVRNGRVLQPSPEELPVLQLPGVIPPDGSAVVDRLQALVTTQEAVGVTEG